LDYHQDTVQVCVVNGTGQVLANRSVRNEPQEVVRVISEHGQEARMAIEACCGAAALADRLIQATGWTVQQAHPGYVNRMKQNPDKTDYADARMLAELMRVGFLPTVWLPPPAIRDLRQLVRYRQQLVNQRRNTKLRIRALLREQGQRALKGLWTRGGLELLRGLEGLPAHARWVLDRHVEDLLRLEKALAQVTTRFRAVAEGDAVIQHLLEQSGIGLVTACVLRAEIGQFERFANGKQLARFCGLSPRNASSGARQADAGLIRAGNALLRATLIEAAQRLTRCDPRWKAFKARLRAVGKPGSVIAAAVANRWVRGLLHGVVNSNRNRVAA
jgi:transposase